MPKLMRVHHVNITVPTGNEKECAAFYEGLLGLKRAFRPTEIDVPGIWYDLGNDNQVHVVFSGHFRQETVGDHFAVEVDDMDALLSSLRAHDVEVRGPNSMNYDRSQRAFCRDPFGNQIEFMYYLK